MTLLEKAMQEHPTLDEDRIISFLCPCDFGYEKLDDGCNQMAASGTEACRVCWNREAVREAGDTSSAAAAAPSPQGEGKEKGGGGGGV